jgi:2,4-dienoyl-CoA reductase-like NADH-dependent reductase (Old Yellow Enzyme family)
MFDETRWSAETLARYFKYRTLEEIQADAIRLQLSLRFQTDLSPLLEKVRVAGRMLGNAFCVQPMEGCDGTTDGTPDELTMRRYDRFGAGGAKLIWGEAAAVVEEGRANPRQLWLHANNARAFAEMLRRCRVAHRTQFGDDSDLLVGIQLTHSGRYGYRRPLLAGHCPVLDPRTIADKSTGRCVESSDPLLSDDELARLVDHYVTAAKLAHDLGFDFVDIKQCHRYLLNELLGARTRPGRYGGSFENRTRFAREVFQAIRAKVPGITLATRINAYDGIPFHKGEDNIGIPSKPKSPLESAWGTSAVEPFGPDPSEPITWIREMRSLGVALVNISMGNPYASPHVIRPFEYPPPDGYETPEHPLIGVDRHFRITEAIQREFPDLPIVGSGYSYLQEFLPHAGAANCADKRVTLVGVGRATLAQPDFVRQLHENGRLDRKRICRTFSYCTALMRSKHNELGQFATGCPPFDKETYGPIWQDALQKKST